LTNGSRLVRNTALNLVGYCAPLIVAVFSIPPIVRGMGTDRFGILTLAWVLIGYLSLLDLGLSRALTKLVAEKLGAGSEEDIPSLIWTAIIVMFIIGVVLSLSVIPFLPWMVQDLLKIPHELEKETLNSFYLLAISIPIIITSVGFRGVLDAHQRFDLTNAVRIPLGIYSFSAPLLVLPLSKSLEPVVIVLLAGRAVACIVQMFLCFRIVPSLRYGFQLERKIVGPLISFGSWTTITNVINPLLVYLDRFFIGAVLSITAVAYYAMPSEIVTKLFLISGSMMAVLFPAFSTSFLQDRDRTILLFGRGVKYVFLLVFPVTLLFISLAGDCLLFWLGDDFAENSTAVLQWLSLGVFIYSLSQVPLALIHGAGRPDLTAKLHLLELPAYLLILWFMTTTFGILGTAIAWVIRTVLDSFFLFAIAQYLLKTGKGIVIKKLPAMGAALVAFCIGAVLDDFTVKCVFLLVMFLTYLPAAWFFALGPEEKSIIGGRFKIMQQSG